jgi:hypothetical protein
MADTKISALTAVVTPAATDEFAVNQGGTSKKETRAQLHALESGEHLVLPQVDEEATPTLAFGDGNSGFFESADNAIEVSIAGSSKVKLNTGQVESSIGTSWLLPFEVASATNPTLCPTKDFDTGIGSAAADQLSLIAGGLEVARIDGTVGTKGQVLLPTEDLPATPTVAFGDGDSGFYEAADDLVRVALAGSAQYSFEAGKFRASANGYFAIQNELPSATNPVFTPSRGDVDTGIGHSLIAGGIEALRITEASSINTFDFDAGDNVAPQVGALTSLKSVSATVPAATAATLTASSLIPAGSFMLGLTLRVETEFDNTSSLTTFSVGDGSDADRWGTAIARTAGTTVDLTDATASAGGWFTAANDVVLTADAGTFNVAGGSCDIIIHYLDLTAATG